MDITWYRTDISYFFEALETIGIIEIIPYKKTRDVEQTCRRILRIFRMCHYSVILASLDMQISLASYRPLDASSLPEIVRNPISEHRDGEAIRDG